MDSAMATTLLVLAFLSGCSHGPVTYSVSGTITYKDQPIADAQVGFVPTDATGAIKPARGQTDAQGRYTLSTYLGPGDDARGAMAGSYKVTVQKGLAQNQIISYDDLKKHRPEIPPRYGDASQTPLTAAVTAGAANVFDCRLTDP
jgi:hypothetical protein